MSSSIALKYNIQTKPSFVAKVLVMLLFFVSFVLLFILWGIGWFSFPFIVIYIVSFIYFTYFLKQLPLQYLLSDNGSIEINSPIFLLGNISSHSFYNNCVLFLCIEEHDPLQVQTTQKHNKPKKWLVMFCDSVTEKEYRLMARLITSARWA